jgi:hypothetical protein
VVAICGRVTLPVQRCLIVDFDYISDDDPVRVKHPLEYITVCTWRVD